MKKLTALLLFSTISIFCNAQSEMPKWFKNHMEFMVGNWKTSNDEYKSDKEPIEAFGMTWDYGIGKQSLVGSLYAYKDGEKTGNLWEFRAFYNPGDQKVYLYQFGTNGTVGMGVMEEGKMLQTFYHTDGSEHKVGHKVEEEPGIHKTWSFNVSENGEWKGDRYYVWEKM